MLASFIVALFACTAFAAPSYNLKVSGCSLANIALTDLPTGQTQLVTPTTKTSFIGIGVGVQNYTCGTTGTFASAGAVAELFDISCLKSSQFNEATDLAFDIWEALPSHLTAQDVIKEFTLIKNPVVLGQHFFITNPLTGTGLSPKWDFTSASEKGHSDAFVVGAKVGDIPAPSNSGKNVDWLALNGALGDLANQVFRIETRGGQPPTSCTAGATTSVKYVSQYWLFGGSF